MLIKWFLNTVFGRKNLSPLEKIRKSKVELLQRVVEKKIEELSKNGERGPRAHLRYLALKDLYRDREAMKRFIFDSRSYLVDLKDVENIGKVKEEERPLVHNRMDSWERSLDNTMEAFSKLIERKVSELKIRGSIDDGVVYGLEFLALEELFEENELVNRNIKKEDWKKARYANCLVACIEDLESRIKVDKILRKELGQETGSYVYKTYPKLNLSLDVLNRVYGQKRKSLLAQGQEDQLRKFGIQEAYRVNIEKIIYNYKKAKNFMLLYHPSNQTLGHVLKVLDIEDDIVIAQDLHTGMDKSNIKKYRVADLIAEGEEIFVVMDDDVLTKEELSTIILSTEEIPTVEKIVNVKDVFSNSIIFTTKYEKLQELHDILMSDREALAIVILLSSFSDGIWHNIYSLEEFLRSFILNRVNKEQVLPEFTDGVDEFIICSSKSFKEKYFKEDSELPEDKKKSMKMAIGEAV